MRAMVFPVVMYGYENWILRKVECWRTWCFLIVVLEKILESSLGSKEIKLVNPKANQSWIFNGTTDDEGEAPILWPPDAKSWLTGKTLMLGKIKGRRRGDDREWDGWMASPTQWTWVLANSGRWWRIGKPSVLQSMGSQRIRHDLATEQQIVYLSCNICGEVH